MRQAQEQAARIRKLQSDRTDLKRRRMAQDLEQSRVVVAEVPADDAAEPQTQVGDAGVFRARLATAEGAEISGAPASGSQVAVSAPPPGDAGAAETPVHDEDASGTRSRSRSRERREREASDRDAGEQRGLEAGLDRVCQQLVAHAEGVDPPPSRRLREKKPPGQRP